MIDPAKAMKGSAVGWQGPWGTTYAANLRLTVSDLTVQGFVLYISRIEFIPPMPGYNLRKME